MTPTPPPTAPSDSSCSDRTVLVDPGKLTAPAWATHARHLQPAIDRSNGETTRDAVLIAVLQGRMQLWAIGPGASAVTRLVTYDSGLRVLVIALAGGPGLGHRAMRAAAERLEEFASAMGCSRVRIFGRRGWAKVLRGYGQPGVILEKEV